MRSLKRILAAPFRPRHYQSLINLRRIKPRWEFIRRYIFESGSYPWNLNVSLNGSQLAVTVWGFEDLFTVAEIFLQDCYRPLCRPKLVIDLGGNIGLSSLYFLALFPESRVIAYEPNPLSLQRFLLNTLPFRSRIEAREVAVAGAPGTLELGIEPTGRYCGIGAAGPRIGVRAETLENIVASVGGQIDVLKVDVEGAERWVVPALSSLGAIAPLEVLVEGEDVDVASLVASGYRHSSRQGIHRFLRSGSVA